MSKSIAILLFLLPLALLAQEEGEIVFKIAKPAPVAVPVALVPNFDTLRINPDTLITNKEYYFTLTGVDSAALLKIVFTGGNYRPVKAVGDHILLLLSPYEYVRKRKDMKPVACSFAVYCSSDSIATQPCFKRSFYVMPILIRVDDGLKGGIVIPVKVKGRWIRHRIFGRRSKG